MSSSRAWAGQGTTTVWPWGLAAAAAYACGCSAATPPVASPVAPIVSSAQRSNAAERRNVAVTVYNSNFALVREERRIALGVGRVSLAYEDVSAHIQPETVHIRSLRAPEALVVLEQNYRYDLLSPEKLLEKYVGKRVAVARYDRQTGTDQIRQAELLSAENGAVLRIDGEIVTGGYDRFIFPELPPDLLARPTLVWLLDSTEAEQQVEVTYLTRNLSWRADYVLVLGAEDSHADLSGWVTLDNQSGTSFSAAELRLVAGDVNRVAPPMPPPAPEMAEEAADFALAGGSAFHEEALFEYHLYALTRPTDLRDREQKQVNLLEAHDMQVKKKLVFRGAQHAFRSRLGQVLTNQKVSVLLEIDNTAERGLGLPLPQGIWRVYKADGSGAQQFVGEDAVDHTPEDEQIELELGESFDVVADRRQVAWRSLGSCSSESDWAITLRNHKSEAAQVEVLEPTDGDWTLVTSSHPAEQRSAQSLAFALEVPAAGTTQLTYRVRVRWC
jgi:hypothetical protein